jgi:Type IV secretion system pilin
MKKSLYTYIATAFVLATFLVGPLTHAALLQTTEVININNGTGGQGGYAQTSSNNSNYFTGNSSNGSNNISGGVYGGNCSSNGVTLCSVINLVIGYLNQALVLLIGLSVIVFVYYVFKYFIKSNEKRSEGNMYIMYSLIGFFVILSMWGLVNILQNTFGLGNSGYAHRSWTEISNIFPR